MCQSLILTAELLMLLCLLLCSTSPAASWLFFFFFFLRLTQLTLFTTAYFGEEGNKDSLCLMLTSIWTQICCQHNTDSSLMSPQPGDNGILGHFLRGLHDVVAHQRDTQILIQQSEMSIPVKCDLWGQESQSKHHEIPQMYLFLEIRK